MMLLPFAAIQAEAQQQLLTIQTSALQTLAMQQQGLLRMIFKKDQRVAIQVLRIALRQILAM